MSLLDSQSVFVVYLEYVWSVLRVCVCQLVSWLVDQLVSCLCIRKLLTKSSVTKKLIYKRVSKQIMAKELTKEELDEIEQNVRDMEAEGVDL